MKAFDFFCGAGGLTRGLLDAGVQVLVGVDVDGRCRDSYERNNPHARFVPADIRDVTLAQLRQWSKKTDFREMLFAGCAPCQPFSAQQKGSRRHSDARLLLEFGRVVSAARPGYVLIENVPGMARVPGASAFRRFAGILRRSGYRFAVGVLDAKDFGVPQTRRRLVLLASRTSKPSLPAPRYGRGKLPYRTVRQAIAHFPALTAGQEDPEVPNHAAASLSLVNKQRLRHTPTDGGDRRDWPAELRLECHKNKYEGYSDVYGRMAWDTPSPTLTGRCHSISNGRYGHPRQNRAISLREAAALQTFSDAYRFYGTNKHIALQIGNAVPVLLAQELGRHLLDVCIAAARIRKGVTKGSIYRSPM